MALPQDLMGLGMAPALANLEGVAVPAAIAGATTAQATATALPPSGIQQVTTAVGQTALRLSAEQPLATPVGVYNSTATAALVFPPTGGNINEVAANSSFSVAQARLAWFWRVSATKWVVTYGA
jgi:hypothetical protein